MFMNWSLGRDVCNHFSSGFGVKMPAGMVLIRAGFDKALIGAASEGWAVFEELTSP